MSSDNKESNIGRGLQALMADIQLNADRVEDEGELEALRERLDSLELLVEEFGQARELQSEIQEYVRDLKEEVADLRNYRFWVTAVSVTMSISLFAILIACVISRPAWFLDLDGSLQVPFLLALGAGSVYLMSLNLRGVYRSRHERNHGEMLPEVIKAGLDSMRGN